MKRLVLCAALLLPLAALAAHVRHHRRADPEGGRSSRWTAIQRPPSGPARWIGAYNAGCVQGAVALPASGPGYEVMHLQRHRYFGHPVLVGFVRRLAARAT